MIWEIGVANDFMPLVVPLSKEGNKSTISLESEPFKTIRIEGFRDLQEFCVPSHMGGLVFEPAPACNGKEM